MTAAAGSYLKTNTIIEPKTNYAMKKIFLSYITLLLPAAAIAQDTNQNYVKTTTYKTATYTPIATPSAAEAAEAVTYFDGLGRPIQQRAYKQSNTGKDIVTHTEYDTYGRPAKEFLPFVSGSATLGYSSSAGTDVMSFYSSPNVSQTGDPYFEATGNPFSEKQFEASPLNRVLKQAAPGNAWAMNSGHEVKIDYLTNSANEVKYYKAPASWQASQGLYVATIVQQPGGFYAAGELYKTVTKDENWTSGTLHTTEEFKDKEGRVVLKKTYSTYLSRGVLRTQPHETYYVYDQFGNLAFVLPPLLTSTTQQQLDGLCYQYRYDRRNRLVEKKLPGKQWEFMIYDQLDRLVATGPAYAPFPDLFSGKAVPTGWLVTKYDAFGRVAYTGWMASLTATSAGRKTLQDERDLQTTNLNEAKTSSDGTINGVTLRYSNVAWPTSGYHVLTVSYYDDYAFPGAPTTFGSVEGQTVFYNNNIKPRRLPTGSWTRALQSSTSYAGETSYSLYNEQVRVIQTKTTNYLGGYTRVDSKLDFSGKTLYAITAHKRLNSDTELKVREDFTYSDQDRLLTHTHKINTGAAQLLAKNEYSELGQLIRKNVGGGDTSGATAFQKVGYRYNVRGWLKDINDSGNLQQGSDPNDLFAFKINYNLPVTGAPLFNGNIAETDWKTASDNKLRRYSYTYDPTNRLTSAVYIKEGAMTGSYNEWMQYDKNGNITSLGRNGGLDSDLGAYIQIDELSYVYNTQFPNRLEHVEDTTTDPQGFQQNNATGPSFFYDDNGNMIQDLNKNITQIQYNHLNLPIKIVFGSEANKIEYLYDAAGIKLKKTITTPALGGNAIVDYLGGFQYKNNLLEFFPTAEGYVRATPNSSGSYTYSYVFNYTDHLGNIRLSYAEDPQNPGTLSILEENHYYPFGLKHTNYNSDLLVHKQSKGGVALKNLGGLEPVLDPLPYNYKYQGQERQDELGLNWDSFKYRNYDYAIGRFMSIDPLTEKYSYQSPYNFAENKVIDHFELEGLEGVQVNSYDKNGNLSGIKYKLDVYVVTGTKGTYRSNFTSSDVENVRNALKTNFSNTFTDPDSGVPVTFEFTVKPLFMQKVVTDDNGNKELINPVMTSGDVSRMAASKGTKADDGFMSHPALVFGQDNIPHTDGGQTGAGVKVDKNSPEGFSNAVGHELLHFMLDRLKDDDHKLKGGLGRPITFPFINDDILKALKEYVPRASQLDTQTQE